MKLITIVKTAKNSANSKLVNFGCQRVSVVVGLYFYLQSCEVNRVCVRWLSWT